MGEDFEKIFLILDEGIFVNISEEKTKKSARKIPQIFFSTLRTGSHNPMAQSDFSRGEQHYPVSAPNKLFVSLEAE